MHWMFIVGLFAAMGKALRLGRFTAPPSGRTPAMPHKKRHSRMRAHAPNDGHWHMKFHRKRP